MTLIGVVVVNWNAREVLAACLQSLSDQTTPPGQVIVIDNGSTDGSPEQAETSYRDVKVVRLSRNHGYCVAANMGIAALTTDLVLLLNNDTVCEPGFLAALEAAACDHPEVSMFTPRVMRLRDPSRIDNCGTGLTPWLSGYQIGAGRIFSHRYATARQVFGASGAALLARRSLFDRIGDLDADLDYDQDDFDLSFRARIAGEQCRYVPDAVVYHHGSLSARRMPERTLRRILRNQEIVLIKMLTWELVPLLPVRAVYLAFQLFKWGLRGHFRLAVSAKLEALSDLTSTLRKRRAVHAARRVPSWVLWRSISWPDKDRAHLA